MADLYAETMSAFKRHRANVLLCHGSEGHFPPLPCLQRSETEIYYNTAIQNYKMDMLYAIMDIMKKKLFSYKAEVVCRALDAHKENIHGISEEEFIRRRLRMVRRRSC